MPYRVKELDDAEALIRYWLSAHGVECHLDPTESPMAYKIVPSYGQDYHPDWREINDAFVAGRISARVQLIG